LRSTTSSSKIAFFRVEVEVERPRCDAGNIGKLDDRRIVVAELPEHLLGGVEQPAPRVEAALGERTAVDVS